MTAARRPRIFVTQPVAKSAIARLREVATVTVNPDASRIIGRRALIAAVRRCDILFCLLHDQIDAGVIAANANLRLVAAQSITPSNIDVEAATARGIPVTVVPARTTEATADLAFRPDACVARRVVEGDRLVRAGKFPGAQSNYLLGSLVWNKTLGLVGGGGLIGKAVARRAHGFGMRVLYSTPRRKSRSGGACCRTDLRIARELARRIRLRLDPFAAEQRDAPSNRRAPAEADEAHRVSDQYRTRPYRG